MTLSDKQTKMNHVTPTSLAVRIIAWLSRGNPPKPKNNESKGGAAAADSSTLRERALRRPVKRTSIRFLRRAEQLWWILFASLALDLPFFYYASRSIAAPVFVEIGFIVAALCAVIAISGLWRASVLPWIYRFGELRNRILSSSDRGWWVLGGIIVVLGLIEVTARVAHVPATSRIIASIISIIAVWKTVKAFLESREYLKQLQHDKIAWVEHANLTIFLIHVIPSVAARLFVAGAVLASIQLDDPLMTRGTPLSVWGALIVGVFALLALKPRDDDFVVNCPRCGFVTSRALEQLKLCPACSPETFWGKTPTK